jgi:hypothetical protein
MSGLMSERSLRLIAEVGEQIDALRRGAMGAWPPEAVHVATTAIEAMSSVTADFRKAAADWDALGSRLAQEVVRDHGPPTAL